MLQRVIQRETFAGVIPSSLSSIIFLSSLPIPKAELNGMEGMKRKHIFTVQ